MVGRGSKRRPIGLKPRHPSPPVRSTPFLRRAHSLTRNSLTHLLSSLPPPQPPAGGGRGEEPLPKSANLGAPPPPPGALQAAPGNDGLPPTQPPSARPAANVTARTRYPKPHPASGMARHSNPQAGVRTASVSHSRHAGRHTVNTQTAPGLGDRRGTTLSPGVEVSRPSMHRGPVSRVSSCCRGIEVSSPVEGCRGLVSRCRGQGSGTTLYGKNRTPPTDERSRNRSAAGGARQGRARDRARSPLAFSVSRVFLARRGLEWRKECGGEPAWGSPAPTQGVPLPGRRRKSGARPTDRQTGRGGCTLSLSLSLSLSTNIPRGRGGKRSFDSGSETPVALTFSSGRPMRSVSQHPGSGGPTVRCSQCRGSS